MKKPFEIFLLVEEKFSCNNAFNNKCTLKLPTNYLDNLSFWCSKIKIMNGTIFLLVGMVKDKFANFWIYSLLSPFESKDYAYTLSITHENGRSKFSHYNGEAHYMFSRIPNTNLRIFWLRALPRSPKHSFVVVLVVVKLQICIKLDCTGSYWIILDHIESYWIKFWKSHFGKACC